MNRNAEEEAHQLEAERKERASLVAWFESCPFAEYATSALRAAYRALTESDE